MNTFNYIITTSFDMLCSPFAARDPMWGLCALSILTGIVMLIIFRFTSNQKGIRQVKNRIKAYFLEARLYNDDLGLIFFAQMNILKNTLRYMRYSLTPMLFLIAPVVLIMIQLSLWFDRHPPAVGESIIVKVTYADDKSFDEDVTLTAPEGLLVETPPVRIQEENEVVWRIKTLEKGSFDLTIAGTPGAVTKQIEVGQNLARLSVRKVAPNFFQQLLYPGERNIPANAGIVSIEVPYPSIQYSVFGLQIHWLVIFFVVSITAGFLLKGIFRVEI